MGEGADDLNWASRMCRMVCPGARARSRLRVLAGFCPGKERRKTWLGRSQRVCLSRTGNDLRGGICLLLSHSPERGTIMAASWGRKRLRDRDRRRGWSRTRRAKSSTKRETVRSVRRKATPKDRPKGYKKDGIRWWRVGYNLKKLARLFGAAQDPLPAWAQGGPIPWNPPGAGSGSEASIPAPTPTSEPPGAGVVYPTGRAFRPEYSRDLLEPRDKKPLYFRDLL